MCTTCFAGCSGCTCVGTHHPGAQVAVHESCGSLQHDVALPRLDAQVTYFSQVTGHVQVQQSSRYYYYYLPFICFLGEQGRDIYLEIK